MELKYSRSIYSDCSHYRQVSFDEIPYKLVIQLLYVRNYVDQHLNSIPGPILRAVVDL